jgi:hypothetical protein
MESSCRPRLLSGPAVAHAEAKICELSGLSQTDSLQLDASVARLLEKVHAVG